MPVINLLSNETIDKIAAGEVVERPVNVVKELAENSVDAGATVISVEISGGGSDLIRVTDNGVGISEEDCKMAFLRHATSKLSKIEDLDSLVSLGFRGEALSSVCAVSKCELITKKRDSLLGTRVVAEGGKILEISDVGAPDGTTLIVRQLFYNTPPRKKFLKSQSAEGAAIADFMEKLALSHPTVSFRFIMNKATRLSTSGSGDIKDVVYRIFGKDVYESLLPVDYKEEGISVKGFTAKPEFVYKARNGEIYFVNGRVINSKVIRTAIEEVYRNYLMQHQFPFCVLYIDIDPSKVDVNVHPRKAEVKFDDDEYVRSVIIKALNDAFNEKDLIPTVSLPKAPFKESEPEITEAYTKTSSDFPESEINIRKSTETPDLSSSVYAKEDPEVFAEEFVPEPKPVNSPERLPEPFEGKRLSETVFEKAPEIVQETIFDKKLLSDEPLKEYRIIGQVFD
ncbi:MAG: DNA mismatch repair endonuclease MutL, partial [Lachnospiraceae bacterium]|nr:DNA mismatch repair endonuclease MutL [Lachnospiraceae bacterium]